MAVVIKQLIIKAEMVSANNTPGNGAIPASAGMALAPDQREALIQECIRQMTKILEKQKDR